MNKKLIVSKTVLFVFIILFILGFQTVFGTKNTLIGVTVITAALMLLERDFTLSPFKYLIYLIGINLFLGISAFVASKNLWMSIPINFITMFSIGFLLCYNLKSNMYIPFGLQYLFMISVSVDESELSVRLLSLVVGSIFIIMIQIICNKNKLVKCGNEITEKYLRNLLKKIELLITEKDTISLDKCMKKHKNKLNNLIFSKREDSFYLTEGGRINNNIITILECINNTVSNLYKEFDKDDVRKVLNDTYNKLNKILQNKNDIDLLKKIKNEESNIGIKKIVNNLDILCNCFIKSKNVRDHNYIDRNSSIPSEFNFINIIKRDFKISTLKFSYAFRVAVCVTISIFIMDYFKIYEGRWMAYTVFSLVQPYSEHSKVKSRQRVKGTLIGAIIFAILFMIFKNPTIRSLIVMGVGYIDGYNTRYDRKIICVTISALGVAVITSTIEGVLFYRILFVGLGVVVALIANKFIFPYNLKRSYRDLISMSNSTIEQLVKEVKVYTLQKNNNHSIENLFIIFSIIENKLNTNEVREYKNFIKSKREFINNIYEKYLWVENNKISYQDFENFVGENLINCYSSF